MIRSKAIVEYCKQCRPDDPPRTCPHTDCPLWVYRQNRGVPKEVQKDPKITRGKMIRKHCLECCNGSANEVRQCAVLDCELYEHRVRPYKKKIEHEHHSTASKNDLKNDSRGC